MRRGQIVIGRAPGEFTTRARPYVVVQNDATLDESQTITVCPLTTELTGTDLIRIAIDPDAGNGLARPSEIEVDLIVSMRRMRIDTVAGIASSEVMARVDSALKRWLSL